MKIISIVLMFEPGKSTFDSILIRASDALTHGAIKALPTISKRSASFPPYWVVDLEVTEADWPFWFGFYLGKDFSINNREIVLGVDATPKQES